MNALPRILLVDDEAPARQRLRHLLEDIAPQFPHCIVGEAGDGLAALEVLAQRPADIVLADIRMPRMDGIELAQQLAGQPMSPAIVFVTAYDEFALKAFELSAADYLLKPVRAPRLLDALRKARRLLPNDALLKNLAPTARARLRVLERGRVMLVPVDEILYLRADQKYVAACTAEREYLLEESLTHLETEFAARFVRIHRNCLVAIDAVAGAARVADDAHGEAHWVLTLKGVAERLPVSRRQWPHVKERLGL
ncbi:LytR/AlgR family response regulator transcription factor [Sulfuricystis multivorans]|uniref:LytR/AlgR family response regulator transcription factor n=1 Tax=Sulfuricystis multivorans TaxID=2211108 RepID=UPI000F82D3B5|nr:LytTR family DNA-binding domain-containing protein [Sulfuricystis multivorans]